SLGLRVDGQCASWLPISRFAGFRSRADLVYFHAAGEPKADEAHQNGAPAEPVIMNKAARGLFHYNPPRNGGGKSHREIARATAQAHESSPSRSGNCQGHHRLTGHETPPSQK